MPVHHCRIIAWLLAASVALAAPARAQSLPRSSPFNGGVPSGTASAAPINLTIGEAIARALEHNLGLLIAEQAAATADGERRVALSRLLPNLTGSVSEIRRKTSLEVFGFPLGPGFPRVVGPYNVFDARVFLTQSIFDADAINEKNAAAHHLAAARHTARGARSIVVLASANMYLQALAAQARAAAAAAQLASAQAIHQQALDLRQGGIVAGIDVVRADVRVSTDRQRATATANDAEKAKLQLARIIGLPIGQTFNLVDDIPVVPEAPIQLPQALESAYAQRSDYLAAIEEVKAAESAHSAAVGDHLPSVRVTADYGTTGLTPGSALPTFSVMGAVDVPIFEGGKQKGRVAQADARLRQRRAEAEDMKAAVYYDVRTAFLDLEATQQQLEAATRGRSLAAQQLEQSRDRFAAGVASNIEVIQAQEAVAEATELSISAQYGVSVAKALLAQSIGLTDEALMKFLKGPTP